MSLPLFVYGTFMTGQERAALLDGLDRRPARARGRLYLMPAGWPAMQLARPHEDVWVSGELVAAPSEAVLSLLDRYEGVAEGLFQRTQVTAIAGLGSVPAWAWVMSAPRSEGGRLLPGGRWYGVRRR